MYSETQVRKVLKACNIRIVNELSEEFIIFCLWHPNYRTASCEINKTTGQAYCFACNKSATLVEVVQKSRDQTVFQATRLIASKAEEREFLPVLDFEEPAQFVEFDPDLIARLHQNALVSDRCIEYLGKRLIRPASIVEYNIGYSKTQDMVTVPLYSPDGMVVGFVGRSIEGKIFKNSDHLPKAKTWWNLQKRRLSTIIVAVESIFDAIRIEQCGYHAIASMGSPSKRQIALLEKTYRNVVFIPDADDAGKMMAAKMITKMGNRVSVAKLKNAKDVGELNDEELTKFLESATDLWA